MEACIEALYTIDGEADKRKTFEMIRILKGAISVSKSRTGEVIYHYNRHEKRALSRTMDKYDRDTVRARVNIDSQKRDVLRKWNLVFGRQRKFTESIRGFDDMIQEALQNRHLVKSFTDDEDEDDAEALTQEVQKVEVKKMPDITDPRARRLGGRQTAPQGVVSTPVIVGVLPKLQTTGNLRNAHIETPAQMRMRKEREAELERKRKQAELPQFDKELMDAYLTEQKTLQEDLLTRNALMKIKTSVDRDHVFFKYRLKTKLPDSATSLLHQIGSEWSVSAMTSGTRHSMRSRLSTRQSTRQGARPKSPTHNEEVEETTSRLDKISLTARDASPSHVSDIPQLERAKTVHFC